MEIIAILIIILFIEVNYLVYRAWLSGNRSLRTKRSVFVDTSALMDGRIVTAAQAGFIPSDITIPRSVVNELQLLADQADAEKRSRARRGLDAISELQDMKHLTVHVIDDGSVGSGGVDQRLIDLAKRSGGSICTIDFNLNKVATVQGIQILNVNELAGGIRMAFLPGETISLGLTQKGQSASQAVGYLADGTMVVVDKASSMIGQTVEIEFIRSLQTAAGRMMFAKLMKQPEAAPSAKGRAPTAAKSSDKQPAGNRSRRAKQSGEVVSQQTSTTATSEVISSKQSTSRRRKRTGEDSLLELVDRQQ